MLFDIVPVLNQTLIIKVSDYQTQVELEERNNNNNVVVTNERGMELLHSLRRTESAERVRDVGPDLEVLWRKLMIISQR